MTFPHRDVARGVAGVAVHVPEHAAALKAQWARTVEYLVKTQAEDGTWGAPGSGDAMRSPRCLTLLSWWLKQVGPTGKDPYGARAAVEKFMEMLRASGPAYGIKTNTVTTGMAAIAVADELAFGVTYGIDL